MMCVKLGIAALAALALVVAPASAEASRPSVSTSLSVAHTLWGPAPCGEPVVRFDDWTPGRIAFTQPLYDDLAASDCVIHLSPDLEGRLDRDDALLRCHAIVHEYGHLTGHRHTRSGVMARTPHRYYWRCRAAAR